MARELTAGVEYEACARRYHTACERRSDEVKCQCTLPSSAPTFRSGNKILYCCDRCRWAENKRMKASEIVFANLGPSTPESRAAAAAVFGTKGTKKPSK
tara:strand:+ start:204 stop:500 length:297 start_codon:yes stop_codon:yes gene_type:complete